MTRDDLLCLALLLTLGAALVAAHFLGAFS